MSNIIENGRMIFGYMAMMLEDRTPWDSQTIYHQNRCKIDSHGNWWVSKKSTQEAPNINHPFPGFDQNGDPVASEWWALWIDWQHPMAELMAAVNQALQAAQNASDQAAAAQEAAENASQVDVSEHERRLDELEATIQSLTDDDIAGINSAIANLQDLIGTDVDGTINKFNELVAFMAGMGESDTLQGKLLEIAALLAQKQPAGDYATNTRVNELENKVDSVVSPKRVGTHLVFPSLTTAKVEGTHLILAE